MDATAVHASCLPTIECTSACIRGLGKVSTEGMTRLATGSAFTPWVLPFQDHQLACKSISNGGRFYRVHVRENVDQAIRNGT